MKSKFIGIEIKSCYADYSSDNKWVEYLPFVNSFYFCISEDLYEKKGEQIKEDCKEHNVGIMVLASKSGKIKVVVKAKIKDIDKKERKRLLIKAAWRGGDSRRNTSRTKKYYIT
jgi:hypothetical protein